ncbi:MAG TPA: hypothetical protein VLC98_02835 [Phnomibacter sp.]|nr:hypothetical protein [Phnomibacter sp.]
MNTVRFIFKPILIIQACLFLFAACHSPSIKDHSRQSADSLNLSFASLSMPKDHDTLGREFARQQLDEILSEKGQPFTWDTLIKDSSIAVSMAEPLLFDIFGKD